MTITAVILADSINTNGDRLTTFQLRYPRFIHAEELTHRILETTPEVVIYEVGVDGFMYDPDLSRNASSSRAIPIMRMIEDIRRDPVMPIYWGSAQKGMQAGPELKESDLEYVKHLWLEAMEQMITKATEMNETGLHKQIANRILEPWAHINVIVTATNFENFYALRCHKDAQPEIKELADQMRQLQMWSKPKPLAPGDWHLPYINDQDIEAAKRRITGNGILRVVPTDEQINEILLKVSVARCARVSYLTFEGKESTIEEDIGLYDRLVASAPLHASPCEHQATPDVIVGEKCIDHFTQTPENPYGELEFIWQTPKEHGNLTGWRQYRKMLPGEYTPSR